MAEGLNGRNIPSIDVEGLYQQNIDYYKSISDKVPDIDVLRLYFGEDYRVADGIIIRQPTIQDVIDMGEKSFYATIAPFTTNTTAFRVQLWDLGIDWNDVSDFELFSLLLKTITPEQTRILFKDFDFSSFDLVAKMNENNEPVPILYSEKLGMEIDEDIYLKIRKYLCFMFGVTLENEFVKSKSLKKEIIAKARADEAKKLAESKGSSLVQMISFALNHPGFKYKKDELRNVGYVEFYDSIKRLQVYEATRALTQGSYSGFCDVSKVPKENFDFLRSVN